MNLGKSTLEQRNQFQNCLHPWHKRPRWPQWPSPFNRFLHQFWSCDSNPVHVAWPNSVLVVELARKLHIIHPQIGHGWKATYGVEIINLIPSGALGQIIVFFRIMSCCKHGKRQVNGKLLFFGEIGVPEPQYQDVSVPVRIVPC